MLFFWEKEEKYSLLFLCVIFSMFLNTHLSKIDNFEIICGCLFGYAALSSPDQFRRGVFFIADHFRRRIFCRGTFHRSTFSSPFFFVADPFRREIFLSPSLFIAIPFRRQYKNFKNKKLKFDLNWKYYNNSLFTNNCAKFSMFPLQWVKKFIWRTALFFSGIFCKEKKFFILIFNF